MNIALIGPRESGRTETARNLAVLLARLRQLPTEPVTDEPFPLVAICLDRSSSAVYRKYGWEPDLRRSLTGIEQSLQSAERGVAILEDASRAHTIARAAWRKQANSAREENGQPGRARIIPEAWEILAETYRSRVYEAADRHQVDLIEIWGQGAVYEPDPDGGSTESEGLRVRGQSEGPAVSHLTLFLEGGIRSRRSVADRLVRVTKDTSGLATGFEINLPEFRTLSDVAEALHRLTRALKPSLEAIRHLDEDDRAAWALVTEEPDRFPEAAESAEASRSSRLITDVDTLIKLHGLAGQKMDVQARRAEILNRHFGVGSVKALGQVPLRLLEDGVVGLRRELEHRLENVA